MSKYSEDLKAIKHKQKRISFKDEIPKLFISKSFINCNKIEKDKIKKLYKEYTSHETNNFFKTDCNIMFGKNPKGPKYNKNNELIPYSVVGYSELFNVNKKNHQSIKVSRKESSNSISSKSERNPIRKQNSKKNYILKKFSVSDPYEYIDDSSLKSYFNKLKLLIEKNKNNNKDNNLPKEIEDILDNQKKILNKRNKSLNDMKMLEKEILKKCHKTHENLLINNEEQFLLKILKRKKSENRNFNNRYNQHMWSITLRNPQNKQNLLFERAGYTNIGTKESPLFSVFPINSEIELYNKPRYLKTINTNKQRKYLRTLDGLEVKGKNLIDVELERESGFRGRKKLYKNKEIDLAFNNIKESNSPKLRELLFNDEVYAVNYGIDNNNQIFKNYVNSSRNL